MHVENDEASGTKSNKRLYGYLNIGVRRNKNPKVQTDKLEFSPLEVETNEY